MSAPSESDLTVTPDITDERFPGLVLREASLDDGIEIWAMLREIGPGENGFGNEGYDVPFSHFRTHLQRRIDMKLGVNLPDGRVPMTTYWLFHGTMPVALTKLRHALTDSLRRVGGHIGYCVRPTRRGAGYGTAALALTIIAARRRGIDGVLLTCKEENVPSRRVIERNSGRLDRKESGLCYYWIETRAER